MRFENPRNDLGNRALDLVEGLIRNCELNANVPTVRFREIDANHSMIQDPSQENPDLIVSAKFDDAVEEIDWCNLVEDVGGEAINSSDKAKWIAGLGEKSEAAYQIPDYIYSMINGSKYEARVADVIGSRELVKVAIENICSHLSMAVTYRYVQNRENGFLGQMFDLYMSGFYCAGYFGQWPHGEIAALRVLR